MKVRQSVMEKVRDWIRRHVGDTPDTLTGSLDQLDRKADELHRMVDLRLELQRAQRRMGGRHD